MTTPAGNDDVIAQADRWSGVPTGWRAVTGQEMEETGSRVVDSIQAASTADGIKCLERALAPESSHAVRLLELWPTSMGWAFDASDLMVVRLCGHDVSLETCLAIAGDDGAHVRTIARHLRAVPNDRGACMADASTLLAMDSLWSALFEALRAGGLDLADATAAAHIFALASVRSCSPRPPQSPKVGLTRRTPATVHGNSIDSSTVMPSYAGPFGAWCWPPKHATAGVVAN